MDKLNDNTNKYWLIPLLVYCIPNLVIFLVCVTFDIIIVEMRLIQLTLDLFTSIACIILLIGSFVFIVYSGRVGSKFFNCKQTVSPPSSIGIIVFLLQLVSLAILLIFDYGRVGGEGSSSNAFVILFSYLNIDALFLIYYGHARSYKVPFINLIIFIISMLLRGWSGVWLIVFFIEIYYALQRYSTKKLLMVLLLISLSAVLAYPYIETLKIAARQQVNINEVSYNSEGIADSLLGPFDKLVIRFQHITNVMLIAQESAGIYYDIQNDIVIPFYADNIYGRKLFGVSESAVSLQKSLTSNLLNDSSLDLDTFGWYVHTGIAGWLFVIDWYMMPFYCLFVFLLIIFPYWFTARYIGAASIIPVFHMVSLVYVFHGWFSSQINFITGLIWYVLLYSVCNRQSDLMQSNEDTIIQ